MLNERAIAIDIPCQKRRRLHTRGIRMPSGTKSMKLPLAFCRQNARALDTLGRCAEEQVSDAILGWSSNPPVPAARKRELRLGLSVTAARPQR